MVIMHCKRSPLGHATIISTQHLHTGFHPDIFTSGEGGANYSFGNLKRGSVIYLIAGGMPPANYENLIVCGAF